MMANRRQLYVALAVVCIAIPLVNSCFCRGGGGPPQAACDANYVIKGEVSNQRFTEANGEQTHVTHDIKVLEIFKADALATPLLRVGQVFSITKEIRKCKPYFQNNAVHVIPGVVTNGKLDAKGCSYVRPWDQLNPQQITGFTSYYYTNCTTGTTTHAPATTRSSRG